MGCSLRTCFFFLALAFLGSISRVLIRFLVEVCAQAESVRYAAARTAIRRQAVWKPGLCFCTVECEVISLPFKSPSAPLLHIHRPNHEPMTRHAEGYPKESNEESGDDGPLPARSVADHGVRKLENDGPLRIAHLACYRYKYRLKTNIECWNSASWAADCGAACGIGHPV